MITVRNMPILQEPYLANFGSKWASFLKYYWFGHTHLSWSCKTQYYSHGPDKCLTCDANSMCRDVTNRTPNITQVGTATGLYHIGCCVNKAKALNLLLYSFVLNFVQTVIPECLSISVALIPLFRNWYRYFGINVRLNSTNTDTLHFSTLVFASRQVIAWIIAFKINQATLAFFFACSSGNRTPGSRFYSDLLDTSDCIY